MIQKVTRSKNHPIQSTRPKPRSRRQKNKVVAGTKKTRHHRKPTSGGGREGRYNISIVQHRFHDAYHQVFGAGHVHSVVAQLNATWIDPDYIVIAIKRSELNRVKKYLQNSDVI